MSFARRFVVLLLLCFLAMSAHAATINVGPGQLYPTIQSGINAAGAGDTVLVAPGVYYENIDFKGKAITVTSSGGAATTIIDGGGVLGLGTVNFQSGELRTSVLSGFTVRDGGANFSNGRGGGVFVSNSAPTLLNNVLTANACNNVVVNGGAALFQGNEISAAVNASTCSAPTGGTGVVVNGNQVVGPFSHTDFIGNTVENNTAASGTVGGINLVFANGSVVQGNLIRNNSGSVAGGLYVDEESFATAGVTVVGNLSYGNTKLGSGSASALPSGMIFEISINPAGPFLTIVAGNTVADSVSLTGYPVSFLLINNIIMSSSATTAALNCYDTAYNTPISTDHNDIYNASGPAFEAGCNNPTGTFGNISVDPAFANAAAGNYQLTAKSPALDAGNNSAPLLPATDFAGQPRLQVATGIGYPSVDMGAYEYAGNVDTGHTVITLTPSEYFQSAAPSTPPAPLSFTVTLSSPSGQPTGNAAIYEDGTYLGQVYVDTTGTATLQLSDVLPGLHSFTASYPTTGGGPHFVIYDTPAVSPRFYLVVPKTLTNLSLTSSPNPSVYGANTTFTLNTNATGNIALTDTTNNVKLADLTANSVGVASYTTSTLSGGSHTITASVATSATQSAASGSVVQSVSAAPTAAMLAVTSPALGQIYAGAQITAMVTVSSASAPAQALTGTVSFYANNAVLGTVSLGSANQGMLTFTLPAGTSMLGCTYSGSNNFAPAMCGTVVVNGGAPMQTIVFPQSSSPAYAATAVALNAVASSGLPVTYTVVSGPATVTGSTLTYSGPGTVVVEADQPGDGTFPAAAPVQQTVTVALLTETLGVQSNSITTLVTILAPGTLNTFSVTAQGAAGLDFNLAAGGTCLVGLTYSAGQTCTVNFTFKPQHPGLRYGGIALADGTGMLLANSYILGLGNGPQVLYNPPNQTLVGTGFGGLSGVAVDGSGNVYGSDIVNDGIYQVLAATGATRLLTKPLGTSQVFPTDIYVDGSGNVFYTTRTDAAEILAVNGVIPPVPTVRTLVSFSGTGAGEIDGMKVDQIGNVFLALSDSNTANSAIKEIVAVNGVIPQSPLVRTLVSGIGGPTGVAIDVQGDVYFSDQYGHQVYEVVTVDGSIPASPVVRVVSNGFTLPSNLAFDVSGNLYVPDVGTQDVKELLAVNLVLPASPTIVSLGTGIVSPQGVAIDSGGSLFVADEGASSAIKVAYGSAPTLTFAATQVGATSADSPRSVTITNGGNTPLSIPAPLAGTNPAISTNFSIGAATTCPTLTPGMATQGLAPGASCTTAVSFMPTTVGTINGTLVRTDDNLGVPGATQTIVLNGVGLGIPPTIVFTVPNHTFGDAPFTVGATSNSPGAISYSVVSGPATINGTTVTLTGAGLVTLQASQVASGMYAAGTQNASFTVAKKPQTITFVQPVSPVAFSATPITLVATASSGLPVSFSIVSGPGSVSGSSLTIKGGGVIVIAADQPGDANYAPATQVQRSVTVLFGVATVVLHAAPNPSFLLNPVTFSATVSSPAGTPGGLVLFQEGATVLGSANISGGSATIVLSTLAVGSHTIVAIYQGDSTYALATSASVIEVIQDFSLTITNPNVTIQHGGVAVYNIVVSSVGGAGLASTIQLTFTGGPDRAVSTLTPATIATGSGTTAATLTMNTPDYPTGPFTLAFLGLLALPLARRGRRLRGLLAMAAAIVLLCAATGCGSGWKAQRFDVTVTATSGQLVRSAQATLISRP